MPHGESRETSTGALPLAALNAELVHEINGDESCIVNVVGAAPVMTLEFTGSVDGVNYFPVPAYCITGVGGTIPAAPNPFVSDILAATNSLRVYAIRVAQLRRVRVRASAYTSGTADVLIRSDALRSQHPAINDRPATSLLQSGTAAAGIGVTVSLPAVAGLRHYIDFIRVTRSATAALVAAATPVVVTTTNLPGLPALTFGADAAGIGLDKYDELDFGGTGLAATTVGTATTVVCPAYAGVIWRANVGYRLGL